METKTYTTIDRAKQLWPSGPWDGEPDKMQWPDAVTGLPCLAVRHPSGGHWCGYVGVSEGHPAYKKDYNDVDVSVHGGLTFASECQPADTEETGICHVPGKDEPEHVWWIGFDCAHSGDFRPADAMLRKRLPTMYDDFLPPNTYKDLAYVQAECADLAKQLVEMK